MPMAVEPEIVEEVKSLRKEGFSEKQIAENLKSIGYSDSEIAEIMGNPTRKGPESFTGTEVPKMAQGAPPVVPEKQVPVVEPNEDEGPTIMLPPVEGEEDALAKLAAGEPSEESMPVKGANGSEEVKLPEIGQQKPEGSAALALEFEDELTALEGPAVQTKRPRPQQTSYTPGQAPPPPKPGSMPPAPMAQRGSMPAAPAPAPSMPAPAPRPGERPPEKPSGGKGMMSLIIWGIVLVILAIIFMMAAPKLGMELPFTLF